MDLPNFHSRPIIFIFCYYLLLILTIKVKVLVSYRAACPIDLCQCSHKAGEEVINCRQLHLSVVPTVKPCERQFKEISLRQNNIRNLSKNAFQGVQTKILDISSNAISHIHPNAFEGLQNTLEVLRLGLYLMKDFPDSQLSQLRHLKQLHITGCYLPSISKGLFSSFVQLNELHLSSCRISLVGEEAFAGIKESLVVLNLMANELTDIPSKSLKGFKKLKRLILSHNKIISLPSEIFPPLTHVYHLDLSNNNINNINRDAFVNIHVTLKFLKLHKNKLTENVFESFRNLTSINRLEIGNNAIRNINLGSFKNLNELAFMDLQFNDITEINKIGFKGIEKSLKVLICSGNPLREIPNGLFSGFRRLTHLYLDNTLIGKTLKLNSFQGLEKTLETLNIQHSGMEFSNLRCLHNLSRLKVARLSNNSIHFLPDFSFSGMKSLRRLDLTGNNLTYLSDNSLKGLEKTLHQIILKKNNIIIISECTFFSFRVLRDIDLGSNPLQCDCNLAWLMNWANRHYGRYRKGSLDWQCQNPPRLHKKYFRSLEKEDFKCIKTLKFSNVCNTVSSMNITSTAEGSIPIIPLPNNVSSDRFPAVNFNIFNQNISKNSPSTPIETSNINTLDNARNRGQVFVINATILSIRQKRNLTMVNYSETQKSEFHSQDTGVNVTTAKPSINHHHTKHYRLDSEKLINFAKNHTKIKTSKIFSNAIFMEPISRIKNKEVYSGNRHKKRNYKSIKHGAITSVVYTASESPSKLTEHLLLSNNKGLIKKKKGFVKFIIKTEIAGTKIKQAVSDYTKYSSPHSTWYNIKLFNKNKIVTGNITRPSITNTTGDFSKFIGSNDDTKDINENNGDYNDISGEEKTNSHLSTRNDAYTSTIMGTSSSSSSSSDSSSGSSSIYNSKRNTSSDGDNGHRIDENIRIYSNMINFNKIPHKKLNTEVRLTVTKPMSSSNAFLVPTSNFKTLTVSPFSLSPNRMTLLETPKQLNSERRRKNTLLVNRNMNTVLLKELATESHKMPRKSSKSAFKTILMNPTPKIYRSYSNQFSKTSEIRYLYPNQAQLHSDKRRASLTFTPIGLKEHGIETFRPFVLNSATTYFPSSSLQPRLSKTIRRPSTISTKIKQYSLTSGASFSSKSTHMLKSAERDKVQNTVLKSSENLERPHSVLKKSNHTIDIHQQKQVNHQSQASDKKYESIIEGYINPYVLSTNPLSLNRKIMEKKTFMPTSVMKIVKENVKNVAAINLKRNGSSTHFPQNITKHKPKRITSTDYHKELHAKKSPTKSTSFAFETFDSENSSTPIVLDDRNIYNNKLIFTENHSLVSSLRKKSTLNYIDKKHTSEIPLHNESAFPLPKYGSQFKGKAKQITGENEVISSVFSGTSFLKVPSHKTDVTKIMKDRYQNLSSVIKTAHKDYTAPPFSIITQSPLSNKSKMNFYSTIKSGKMAFQATNVDNESNTENIRNQTSSRFHINNSEGKFNNSSTMKDLQNQSHSKYISLYPNRNNNLTVTLSKERRNFNKSVIDNMISENKRIDVEENNKTFYERSYNLDNNDSVKLSHTLANESFANDKSFTNPTNHSKWRIDRNIRNVTQLLRIQKKILGKDNTENSTSNVNLLLGKSYTSSMNSITNKHAMRRNESEDKFVSFEESKKSLKLKNRTEIKRNMSSMHMLPKNNTKPINISSNQDRIINLEIHKIKRNYSSLVSFEVRWNISLYQTTKITAFRLVSETINGSFVSVIDTLQVNCSVYHLFGLRSNTSHLLCIISLVSNQSIFAKNCTEIYVTDLYPFYLPSTFTPKVTYWTSKTHFGGWSLAFIIISVVGCLLLMLFSTLIVLVFIRMCKRFSKRICKTDETKTSQMANNSFRSDESFRSWSDIFYCSPFNENPPGYPIYHNTTLSTLFYSSSEDLNTSEDTASDICREKDEDINETSSTFDDYDNLNKWVIAFQHDPLPAQKVWSISNWTYSLDV